MGMDVDEARRQHTALGVDHTRRRHIRQVANGGDLAVLHRDIRAKPGVSCAVDHSRVTNHQIIVGSTKRRRAQPEKPEFHRF